MSQDTDHPRDFSAEFAHLVGHFIFWFTIVLVTVRCGRRWWLLFQGMMTLGLALVSLISPHYSFNYVMKSLIGELDDYHNFTIRVFSVLYLIYGLMVLYCLISSDNRAVSALMEGLCVAYALEIVCHLILLMRKPTGKPVHYPERGIPFFLSMMLGNFFHLNVGQTGYNDSKANQPTNINARFDALALSIIGASVYAFTEDILTLVTNKTDFDTGHIGALAVASSYILCGAVISLQVDVFTQETRRNLYLCRIFESICCIALILYYVFFHDVLTMTSLWAVLIYGVLAGNALVAINKLPIKRKD
ncbi:hypothetical protein HOLleu_16821 [Holothuria leucospilota]|uniref:Uncharacterized protein n=1 Tax=Holothuria leucospilota TaxID=206669 RepID=A0A9Q1C6Y9_HOLLE|nr:hypothetical protein HOLleu_16821 [Holothuria leucospilota]